MVVFLCLLLCAAEGSQTVGKTDSGIDPQRITWWQETWAASPLELSENHAVSGLSLTIRFRPSTSLTNAIVEIKFPTGIAHADLVNSVYSTTLSVTADTDETIVISDVSISQAGVYGPFGITTRRSSEGQVVDTNAAFASIAVLASVTESTGLTVSSGSGQSEATVASSDSLYFTFSLAHDVWQHDLIIITPSSYYTPSSAVTCTSITVSENANSLYGPDSSYDLPCEVVEGEIVIYGVSQDILVETNLKIKIEISSFTLPEAAYTTGYEWFVSIYRFGTNTLLSKYKSTSRPISLNTGAITVTDWAPVRDYNSVSFVADLEMFMNLEFNVAHAIPASGKIEISFSDVDIQTPVWYTTESGGGGSDITAQCIFTPYSEGSTCTVDTDLRLTIVLAEAVTGNTQLSVVVLTKLGSSPTLETITTYTANDIEIDTSSLSPVSKTVESSSSYEYVAFEVQANDDNALDNIDGRWAGGDQDGRHMFFTVTTVSSWALYSSGDGTTLKLFCPLTETAISFTELFLSSSATWTDKTDSTLATAVDHTSSANTKLDMDVIDSDDRITAYPVAVTGGDYYSLIVGGDDGGGTNYVKLPLIASNLQTFYECYLIATTVTGSGTPTETTTFSVSAARFSVTPAEPNTLSITLICRYGLAGIPLLFEFEAEMLDLDLSSEDYVAEIVMTGIDLNLGVENIPVHSNEDSSVSGTWVLSGGDSTVTLSSFSLSMTEGDYIGVYIPCGSSLSGTINYVCSLQYVESTYGQTNVFFESAGSFATTTTSTMTFTGTSAGPYYPSSDASFTMSLTSSADGNDNFIGIVGPSSTDLAEASISISAANPANTITLTSDDSAFNGNVILGLESVGFKVDGSAASLTLDGIETIQTSGSMIFKGFEAPATAGVPTGSACITASSSGATFTVAANTLSDLSVDISSCVRRGPTNVDTTMNIHLNLQHPVPAGGRISATVDNSWTSTAFTACTSSTGDDCDITSNVVTIDVSETVSAESLVTISVTGLLPPNTGSAGSAIDYLSDVETSYNSATIEENTSITLTCTLSDPGTEGEVDLTAVVTPNAAELIDVDVYLAFTSSISFPDNSIIEISVGFTSWLYTGSDDSIKEHCWTSIEYNSCKIVSGNIQISTAAAYNANNVIEIYLDAAINLPSTAGTTTGGFEATVSWSGVQIATTSSPANLEINEAPAGTLSGTSLISSVDTAGETVSYTFTLASSLTVASDHEFWIIFPPSFDPYIGEAQNLNAECEPDVFYIECESSHFSNVQCAVDHWIVVVQDLTSLAEEEEVSVIVKNVRNPSKTSNTENFQFFHIDGDGTVLAADQAVGTVEITADSQILTLKNVTVSTTTLAAIAEYSFDFYITGTLDEDHTLAIRFPAQYDLAKSRGEGEVDCSSAYYDQISDTPNTAVAWTTTTVCEIEGNWVSLQVAADESKTFLSTDRLRVTVENLPNPQYGLSRSEESLRYDTADTDVFPEYERWSTKFEVFIRNTRTNTLEWRSYELLHAGYIGYDNDNQRALEINNYTPTVQTGRIHVFPGTQSSDTPITLDWPMASESLVLQPTVNSFTDDNGGLKMESASYNFTIHQWVDTIYFRVRAADAVEPGLYYIEWDLDETLESGVSSTKYATPVRTLVEVCESTASTIAIEVAEIPILYKGINSIPFKVVPELLPYSDLTVTLSFTNDTESGIEVSPTALVFNPWVDQLYFEIYVPANYDGSSAELAFELSGSNAGLYATPSNQVITIELENTDVSSVTLIVDTTEVGEHSVQVQFTPSHTGVLYWWLACEGHPGYSFSDLQELAPDLFESPSYLQDLLDEDYAEYEVNLDSDQDSDIYAFLHRRFAEHCGTVWVDTVPVYAGETVTLTMDWLYAETTYTAGGYLDMASLNTQSSLASTTFTTSSMPPVYTLEIELREDIADSFSQTLQETIAGRLGVNPLWLSDPTFHQTTSRRLLEIDSTYFTWYVLFDRGYTAFTPEDIVEQPDLLELIKEDLVSSGIVSSTSDVSFDSSKYTEDTPARWAEDPVQGFTSSSSAVFTVVTTTDGLACVACAREENVETTSQQVLGGLTGASAVADGSACISTSSYAAETLTVTGLSSGTDYFCYFAVCSSYPLWPTCRDGDPETGLSMIELETEGGSNSEAVALLVGFAAFALI